MAERWLPAYDAFSTAEQWGVPASLRRSLDGGWEHLRGRTLGSAERAQHAARVEAATPHMDDFEAHDALAACVMVSDALQSCDTTDNAQPAIEAMLSGFGAIAPSWWVDEDTRPRLWRRTPIKKELRKQLTLLERVAAIAQFDDTTIDAL